MIIGSCRIGTAAYPCDDHVWIFFAGLLEQLLLDFFTDHLLRTCHHVTIRMLLHHTYDDIMPVLLIVDPVSNHFNSGVFEGFSAARGRSYFRAQYPDKSHMVGLSLHDVRTHVLDLVQANEVANGCRTPPCCSARVSR